MSRAPQLLQLAIVALLATSLGFIVISNLVGWTARLPVTRVEQRCPEQRCVQAVFVAERSQPFEVAEHTKVRAGDLVDIVGTCQPRCQLRVGEIWSPRARRGNEFGDWVVRLLSPIYAELFLPGLRVIGTVQNTLTNLFHAAWILVLAQIVLPAVRRRPKILSYEWWLDIIYVLQTQLLYITAAGAAVGLTTRWLSDHTPVLFPGLAQAPLWLQALLAVWVFDFVVYWRHRLEHQLSFLWPIHAVHHTTEKVDVLTTFRLHPLELMLGSILNTWVTARFGVGPEAAGIGMMIYLNYNYYVHSNVRIVYPGFLKYILVSPFMHRWHHAREDQARDKNFGVVFAWNDWLFGTALHPKREPLAYGIDYPEGEVARESYLAHLLYPLQVLVARVARAMPRRSLRRGQA